jgi:long-chain acyl-CoA synthetase
MKPATMFALFDDAARRNGGAPALLDRGETVSYAAFHDGVLGAARRLQDRLERPGGIAIRTSEPQKLLRMFFACAAIGRPALPLDPALPAKIIEILFTAHPLAALIASAESGTQFAGHPVIEIDGGESAAHPAPARPAGHDGEFYWGLTSGTTGSPKLFARIDASWIASFEAAEAVFAFAPGSQILIPGPLHHSLFLYGAVHALCRGHAVLLPGGRFRAQRFADAATRASHIYAVPFMLSEMLKAQLAAPRLQMIFSGGSKLPAALREAAERHRPGTDLVEFYGASETSFVSFHSTTRPAADGSVGCIFPGVRVEIRNKAGTVCPAGAEGEIFVASPMLFSRYVGEEPIGNWFSAGDMGFLDENGCLHLTGRASRLIKSKALKIHPEAIEAALMALPEIRRAAVIDMPDDLRGTIPAATIEFEPDRMLARRALSAHCREQLGPRSCPRRFFVADRLPLTPSGKVAIVEVRDRLLSGRHAYREL